jgi:hypothetical protein
MIRVTLSAAKGPCVGSRAGYAVEAVADAPSALQAGRGDQPFDLVVTNSNVSYRDGSDPGAALRLGDPDGRLRQGAGGIE